MTNITFCPYTVGTMFPRKLFDCIPANMLLITGQSLSVKEYPELYASIGDVYTEEAGMEVGEYFKLPKLPDNWEEVLIVYRQAYHGY